MTISLHHLSIYFFVILLAASSCNSDDQGTSPNSGVTYDDWYWELTIDTFTYRCEGTYVKSGTTADDYFQHWYSNADQAIYGNAPNLQQNNVMVLAIRERNDPTWIEGDECSFAITFVNPSNQTSVIDAELSPANWGQGLGQHLSDNGVTVYNSSGSWGIPSFSTADSFPSSDRTIQITYTPSSYSAGNSTLQPLQYPWNIEPALGEADFNLYFHDVPTASTYSVNCSLRFKAFRVQ